MCQLTKVDGTLLTKWTYIKNKAFDSILFFPKVHPSKNVLTLTYVHPGEYHLSPSLPT